MMSPAKPAPRCRYSVVIFLLGGLLLIGVNGEQDVKCDSPLDIADDQLSASSSSGGSSPADAQSSKGGWCPDLGDKDPCLTVNFTGIKAIEELSFEHPDDPGDDYMETWDLHTLSPGQTVFRRRFVGLQALQDGSNYTVSFMPPIVVEAFKICPRKSHGKPCFRFSGTGCDNNELCPNVTCPDMSECMGVNYCGCPEGQFGQDCNSTVEDLEIVDINLQESTINQSVSTVQQDEKSLFYVHGLDGEDALMSVTHGYTKTALYLQGPNVYASYQGLDCFSDLQECNSFTVSMGMSVSFESEEATFAILGSNNLDGLQGVSVTVEGGDLHAKVLAGEYMWNFTLEKILAEDVCDLRKDSGRCDTEWYYDYNETGLCQRYERGMCGTNNNTFDSRQSCEDSCVNKSMEECSFDQESEACPEADIRYFFNRKNGKCQRFEHYGCESNGNNFEDKDVCMETCVTDRKVTLISGRWYKFTVSWSSQWGLQLYLNHELVATDHEADVLDPLTDPAAVPSSHELFIAHCSSITQNVTTDFKFESFQFWPLDYNQVIGIDSTFAECPDCYGPGSLGCYDDMTCSCKEGFLGRHCDQTAFSSLIGFVSFEEFDSGILYSSMGMLSEVSDNFNISDSDPSTLTFASNSSFMSYVFDMGCVSDLSCEDGVTYSIKSKFEASSSVTLFSLTSSESNSSCTLSYTSSGNLVLQITLWDMFYEITHSYSPGNEFTSFGVSFSKIFGLSLLIDGRIVATNDLDTGMGTSSIDVNAGGSLEITSFGYAGFHVSQLMMAGISIADVCRKDFCENDGQCIGLSGCMCKEGYFGTRCNIKDKSAIMVKTVEAGTLLDERYRGISVWATGSYKNIGTSLELDSSAQASFLEVDSSSNPCLRDPDSCNDGLTMEMNFSITEWEEESVIILMSTGGDGAYAGMYLCYDFRVNQYAVVFQTYRRRWALYVDYELSLKKVFNIGFSWSQDSLSLFVDGVVIGRTRESTQLAYGVVTLPAGNLRLGSCYTGIGTQTWVLRIFSYKTYSTSLRLLEQLNILRVLDEPIVETRPCDSKPCAFGKCRNRPENKYVCQCFYGYKGINCDNPTKAVMLNRFSFLSLVKMNGYVSIKTPSFPLKGYGRVKLVQEGSNSYVKCTGSGSNIELSFERLQKITSLFTSETVSDTSAFSFSFNFKLTATTVEATTKIPLFSMGELEDGSLVSTGMLVYYMNGKIYCILSLPQRRYELSFAYTLEQLSMMKTFDFSFQKDSGYVIRSRSQTETEYTVLGSVKTSSVQSYKAVKIVEAFIGFRGDVDGDYEMSVGRCSVGEKTAAQLSEEGLTLDLCASNYCKNGGVCDGLDHCRCNDTMDFTGPDCSVEGTSITKEFSYFMMKDGAITNTRGQKCTARGDYAVKATETTLNASRTGTYIEVDTSGNPCLADPTSCSSGLTICMDMTFTSLKMDSHLCLLSTGGQAGYGASLTYDHDDKVLGGSIRIPFKSWNVRAKFDAQLNTRYNICLSWSLFDGVAVVLNQDVLKQKREFLYSDVRLLGDLAQNLRFGSCYGVVHSESWGFSIRDYSYYNASYTYLSSVELLSVAIPDPPKPVSELCEVQTFTQSLNTIVSTSLKLFSETERATDCKTLSQKLTEAETSVGGCWNEDDRTVSSTSRLSFIRYTQRPNLVAFKAIHKLLCESGSPSLDADCDFTTIQTKISAFFHATENDLFTIGTCRTITQLQAEMKSLLTSCSTETVDLMETLQVQMRSTVRSICAKSTCNIQYSTSCINESTTLIDSITTDEGYTAAVCKRIKQSMACFTNHTVDCERDTYRGLSQRVEAVQRTYQQHCFLKPPEPADPKDCEAKKADKLDKLYSLLAFVGSQLYSETETCDIAKANEDLIMMPPDDLPDNRQAEFMRVQDAVRMKTIQCFPLPANSFSSSCTCDLTAANQCKDKAEELLIALDVNCDAAKTELTCMREKTHGCTDKGAVSAMWSSMKSYLSGTDCGASDPGPHICSTCEASAMSSCSSAGDICLEDFKTCLMNRSRDCSPLTRLNITMAYRLASESCSGDNTAYVTSLRGDSPFGDLETCITNYTSSQTRNFDSVCSSTSSFASCLGTVTLGHPYDIMLSELKNKTHSLLTEVCGARPAIAGCSQAAEGFLCFQQNLEALLYNKVSSAFCQEDNRVRIEECFTKKTFCDDSAIVAWFDKVKDWTTGTYRNVCNIATPEEVNRGCNITAAATCVKDLTSRVFSKENQICGAVSSTKDCVEVNTRMCSSSVKKKMHLMVKSLEKMTAQECCLMRQSTSCDPAAAIMCILDINHLARLPTADWDGICSKVDSSMDCMRSFTDSCEQCQKETVHYIAERLNEDIVKTCRNPPQTTCKVTKALACVENLKTFAALEDSDELLDDFVCLKVHEAQTCIESYSTECDETVQFTINYELSKVVKLMEAQDCKPADKTKNCVEVLRERVEDILDYDPRSPDHPRCRVPGMKGPEYTDLKECQPDITCEGNYVAMHKSLLPRRVGKVRSGEKSDESGKKSDESGEKSDESDEETKESGGKTKESGGKTKESGRKTKESGGKTKESGGKTKESGGKTKESGGKTKESGGKTKESGGKTKESGGKTKESGGKTKESGGKTKESGGKTKESGGKTKESGGKTKESGGKTKESGGKSNMRSREKLVFNWNMKESHWVCVPVCSDGASLRYIDDSESDEEEGDKTKWRCVDDSEGKSDESGEKKSDESESGKKKSNESGKKKSNESGKKKSDESGKKKSNESGKKKSNESGKKKSNESGSGKKKSNESGKKKSNESGSGKKKSNESGSGKKKSNESGSGKKKSKESGNGKKSAPEKRVFKNRLDHLCAEARVAWTCVQHELTDKTDSKSTILFQTMSGLWSLALQRCEAGEKPFKCFLCNNELTNDQCNMNEAVCTDQQDVCFTHLRRNEENEVTSLSKGCGSSENCTAGCSGGTCTYCCSKPGCNGKEEGPVSPVCSLSYASKCALRLSTSLAQSRHLDCRLFEAEISCMKEVREKCVSDNQNQLFNLTESLYQSVAFKQCLLKLAPPTCSVHSVVSLGMLISSPSVQRNDVCTHFDATYEAVLHAKETSGCSNDLIKQVDMSVKLIRSQLQGFGCPSIDPSRDHCDPAKQTCDTRSAQQCISGIEELTTKVSFLERKELCRQYIDMSTCLMMNSKGCSSTKSITMNAIKNHFELITKAIRDSCMDEVKAVSCDPEDNEHQCMPVKAITECFSHFSIANVFDECQNLQLVHSCIKRYTRGCLPIQRKAAATLIWLQPNMDEIMKRCPRDEEEEEETPYTQVMMCLGEFTMSMKTALMTPSNSLSGVCTHSIFKVQACLARLDLAVQAKLSPLERLYLSNAIGVVKYLEDTMCKTLNPVVEVTVSTPACREGYERAARCVSLQAVGMITKAFLPINEVDGFCSQFYEIESCAETSLSVCTGADKTTAISSFLDTLRVKTYSMCEDKFRSRETCAPKVATSCLLSLSAYMESGNITASDQCGALEVTLSCVKNHTHNCKDDEMTNIHTALATVKAKFQSTCPAQLRPFFCKETTASTCGLTDSAISTCLAPLKSFSVNPSTFYEIEACMLLTNVTSCLRDLSANCNDTILSATLTVLNTEMATLSEISLPCNTEFTIDSLRQSCPLQLPKCSVMSASTCLESRLSGFTGSDIKSIARAAASCVWQNISGCGSLQLTVFKVSITQIFKSELNFIIHGNAMSHFSSLILKISQMISGALLRPKYNLWDLCFTAKTLSEEFENLFVTVGDDSLMFERTLLQRRRNVLSHFTSHVCNDVDLIGGEINLPDNEPDTCSKASLIRHYSYYLVQSIFSGFLSLEDTSFLCRGIRGVRLESNSMSLETCSAGFKKQILFASNNLLLATSNSGCTMTKVCNIKHARHCVSSLGITVSKYGLSKTQEDVCTALRYTDKCVEDNTYRCPDTLSKSFKFRYSMERNVAMQICGGLDEEKFIPKCKINQRKYSDICSKREAENCLANFISNVVTRPTLSRERQCAEYVEARHCLQKTAQSCVEQGDQLSFDGYLAKLTAFFGDSTCDIDDYETECEDGCQLQEAEQCVYSLNVKVMDHSKLRGMDTCVAITEARACLTTKSWKCSSSLKSRLTGKLDTVLRVSNLHEVDCVNVYGCMANFEGLAASMFGFADSEKEDEENKEAVPEIRRPIDPKTPDLDLSSLCLNAEEAWECMESGFHLIPIKKRSIVRLTMTNLWRVVKHRCSNTVRQSCYSCDGAESNEECNQKVERCGDHYQMCENVLKRGDDNTLRYYKSCVKPSFCSLTCSGDDCSSSCCVGDLCNENANLQNDIEPLTCRIDHALKCSINLVRTVIDYPDIQCKSSQLDLECMEKYTRDCRAASFSSLSSTAYQILSSISKTSCSIKVTASHCGSKAILSTYSILKNGYVAMNDKICRGVQETRESVKRIEDQGVCTLTELIPVRQSLAIIEQQTRQHCNKGDNSNECSTDKKGKDNPLETGTCQGMFMKTAFCLAQSVEKFTDDQTAYCNYFRTQTPCLDHIKHCAIPDSIQSLNKTLTQLDTNNCGQPRTPICEPDVCNLIEARACYADKVVTNLDADQSVCAVLRESRSCVNRQTSACFSLQEVTVKSSFSDVITRLGPGCSIEPLEIKEDIFTSLTQCLVTYTKNLGDALKHDNTIGRMCEAYSESKICSSKAALPLLSEKFIKSAFNEFNDRMEEFLEGRCSANNQVEGRQTRDTSCDLDEASRCMQSFNLLSWTIAATGISERTHSCRDMDSMATCVENSIRGCSSSKKAFINIAMSKTTFNKYCIPLIYKNEGCDLDMFRTSMGAVEQLSTSATVTDEEICVNARRAVGWVQKFSSSCTDSATTLLSNRQYFGGVLGNTCAKLTVRLFCGTEAPVNRSCDHSRAKSCMENIDLSVQAEALDGFCGDLKKNVTCARHNVDGCLSSEIAVVSTGISDMKTDITSRSCEIEEDLLEYDGVCKAYPTCSLKGARKCLQNLVDESYGLDDCTLALTKKSCLSAHLQACNYIQIPMIEALFKILLPQASSPSCISQGILPLAQNRFLDDRLPVSLNNEVTCMTQMLDSLEESVLSVRYKPEKMFCSIVKNLIDCRGSTSYGINLLTDYLDSNCQSEAPLCTRDQAACENGQCITRDYFCNGTAECSDGSDEKNCGVTEDAACSQRKASFCLMNQLSFTIMSPFLSLSDKDDLCRQKESVKTCVTARTSACSDRVKNYFTKMVEISETLLTTQGTCEEPKMCIVEQTSDCINALAVTVAKVDLAEDNELLCKQYSETKACVRKFSATCDDAELKLIRENMAEVEALIDDKCDEVPPPPEEGPLCPDIPEEERKCEVFKAIECTFSSYASLIFYNPTNNWENSKSCNALQSTIRCVASNISGCEREKAEAVIQRLNSFRDRLKDRCLLFDTSLCGNPGHCIVEDAGCVKNFKSHLSSPSGRGVCELIKEAQDCISDNTISCSSQSWAQADHNLKQAIGQMKVQVRCDDNNVDECILTYQQQAEKILMSSSGDVQQLCTDIETTQTCIRDRIPTTEMASQFTSVLQNLVNKIDDAITRVCDGTEPKCPSDHSIRSLLEVAVYLATTPKFEKQEFCSNVGLLLSKVNSNNLQACNLGSSLATLTFNLSTSFTELCQTSVSCQQSKSDAIACINNLQPTAPCIDLHAVQFCIGKSVGQCPNNKNDLVAEFNKVLSSFTTDCELFPLFSYSLDPTNVIYMTEGGPSVIFKTSQFERLSVPDNVETRLRVSFANTETTVPTCSNGNEVSQVVTDKCEVTFTESDLDTEEEFVLSPVTDNRVDGYQLVIATFILEMFVPDGSDMSLAASFTLPTYNIVVQDRDVKSAICSSINDPHFHTFDGAKYNYMGVGTFLMYESENPIKIQVQLEFEECGEGGSCNCAAFIRVDNDIIKFDRCGEDGRLSSFVPEFERQGDFTDAVKIMRSADSKMFQIVIATGQIIKVRNNDGLLNIWILASASDKGNTRGLCGSFDDDKYNDLTMPNGTLYEIKDGDIQYGTLTPNSYTMLWRVDPADDLASGLSEQLEDMEITPVCSSCSADGSSCGVFARTETCDLIRDGSVDVTSEIKGIALSADPINAKRRKKRAVPENIQPKPQPGWPTETGWTEQNATDFCSQQVKEALLTQKCEQAAQIVNGTADFDQNLRDCIDDIRLSGGTDYVSETIEDVKQKCIDEIGKDPTFQTDRQAKEVAAEILDLSCTPSDCYGNGKCDKGICKCNPGYLGTDCSINRDHLQPPIINGLRNNGLCLFSDKQDCREIFVEGGNFVQSEMLMCHMEFVEIDKTGYRHVGGRKTLVPPIKISEDLVVCRVEIERMRKTAVLVSVSNDGSNTPENQVFIAYDPTCHDCSHTSRRCYDPITGCDIEGRCYPTGAEAANDTCLECQPASDKYLWTKKSRLACSISTVGGLGKGDNSSLVMVIAVSVVSAILLFIILVVIVLLIKRRSRLNRKAEGYESYPSMHMNPAYEAHDENRMHNLSSTDMEPQNSFCGRHVYPRANTRGPDNLSGENHC